MLSNYAIPWSGPLMSSIDSKVALVLAAVKTYRQTSKKKGDAIVAEPVGSYFVRTNVVSTPTLGTATVEADLSCTIPVSICSADDVQDGRYFERRSIFLSDLASHVRSAIERTDDTAAVTLVPSDNDKHSLRISFPSASVSEPAIVVSLRARPSIVPARVGSEKSVAKTPLYSNSVLEDFLAPKHLKLLHELCNTHPSMTRAIVFLKSWAVHTGVLCASCPIALTGYCLSLLVAKLAQEGIITPALSDENIVRAAWVHLAKLPFEAPSLALAGETFNPLFRTTPSFVELVVRRAAEEALSHKSYVDVFDTPPLALPFRFDAAFLIICSSAPFPGDSPRQIVATITDVVVRSATRKVKDVLVWMNSPHAATVLLYYTSEKEALQLLTVGPNLEDVAAVEAFDQFWGADVISTRQFPDGSIHRCVAWSRSDTSPSSPLVCSLTFALRRHVHGDLSVEPVLGELDSLLKERVGGAYCDAVVLTASHLRECIQFVSSLFENLPPGASPCKINSFDIVSPCSRLCEPFAVRPHVSLTRTTDGYTPGLEVVPTIVPIHCVLSIDDKHKIPDTIEAINLMKGVICAQLSKALQGTRTDIVTMCSSNSIDIVHRGYLFRVYVAHYREVSLLKALQKNGEAQFLERKLFWTARHAKFVKTLAFGHHSFSASVRLARRWVSAMMLDEFLPGELVELLTANAYLSGNPPKSSDRGFVSFLELVATHDWKRELTLPTSTPGPSDVMEPRPIECAMWVLAPYAPTFSPFTVGTPRTMVVHRVVGLARSALSVVSSLLESYQKHDRLQLLASLFQPHRDDFDAVIPLVPSVQLQPYRNVSVLDDPLPVRRYWRLDELTEGEGKKYIQQLAEMEPVTQCLKTIRSRTRDRCMAFVDALGPSRIALVLLSGAPQPQDIRKLYDDCTSMIQGAAADTAPKGIPAIKRSTKHAKTSLKKRQRPAE